jgi:chemotaxis protein CheD
MMVDQGSRTSDLEAQINGGGIPPHNKNCKLGEKNIEMARRILNKYNIPVVSCDVGGYKGRKIYFHTEKGECIIHKMESVRETDWYPERK